MLHYTILVSPKIFMLNPLLVHISCLFHFTTYYLIWIFWCLECAVEIRIVAHINNQLREYWRKYLITPSGDEINCPRGSLMRVYIRYEAPSAILVCMMVYFLSGRGGGGIKCKLLVAFILLTPKSRSINCVISPISLFYISKRIRKTFFLNKNGKLSKRFKSTSVYNQY